MDKVIYATVIGGLHHNTLGVIRALGEKGILKDKIDVLIIANNPSRRNIISACRYVSKSNLYYLDDYSSIFLKLKELRPINEIRKVVICCCDGAAEEVMVHCNELSDYYITPSVNIDIHQMMNKEFQTKIAEKNGLTVPKSSTIKNKNIADWNIYPCITKPIFSIAGAGKSDIKISNNEDELRQALEETVANSVQVQAFIKKSLEFQLIGCSLNEGEFVIIPGYTNIIRQPKNTNTGYLKYSPISQLNCDLEGIKRYIKAIGYSGLFSIEFLRDEDGKDYYMEINMRNDGNAYCVTSAGVNLPFIWVYYNLCQSFPIEEICTFYKPVLFIPDFSDIHLGINEVGFFGWLRQMYQAESHSVYNKKDIKPIIVDFINHLVR